MLGIVPAPGHKCSNEHSRWIFQPSLENFPFPSHSAELEAVCFKEQLNTQPVLFKSSFAASLRPLDHSAVSHMMNDCGYVVYYELVIQFFPPLREPSLRVAITFSVRFASLDFRIPFLMLQLSCIDATVNVSVHPWEQCTPLNLPDTRTASLPLLWARC